jgi:16S rRNA (cytidine1402-2'-O)-methyltransferase
VGERPETRGTAGRLFVIGTPIGNLADLTIRARETLASVPLVAAEDTRITRRLTAGIAPAPRLVSFHARNAGRRLPELLDHLRGGADLGLVTDAGTPGVSDPGAELVAAWSAEGGTVVPVPGPSAVTTAVSATGIAGSRWVFEGFLPRRGRVRRERLAALASDGRGAILFEAPERLPGTLAELAAACGDGRPAAVCRELTKIHEEIVIGPLGELAARVASGAITSRGEVVVVVGATDSPAPAAGSAEDRLSTARAAVERLVADGVPRGEAARRVARSSGLSRRRLYRE